MFNPHVFLRRKQFTWITVNKRNCHLHFHLKSQLDKWANLPGDEKLKLKQHLRSVDPLLRELLKDEAAFDKFIDSFNPPDHDVDCNPKEYVGLTENEIEAKIRFQGATAYLHRRTGIPLDTLRNFIEDMRVCVV
eukprot:TRINITY_DN4925_c0_g2_i2.p1 TRINITY_DN4925_c0_g2~~TRINITY_DN4925_c0_g2_i2.p1  ORF type:complete len:154 (+),score=33.09 TRINITY_DN4925_c0_g2_i2:61-462(+)